MTNKGFTLLECLVSIGLLTLLLSLVMPTIFMFSGQRQKEDILRQRTLEKDFITQHLAREIRNATQVLADSNTQHLHLQDNSAPPKELYYELISKRLREKRGGAYLYLTNMADIDSLLFNYSGAMIMFQINYVDGDCLSGNTLVRSK